jgi:hypothetical protein
LKGPTIYILFFKKSICFKNFHYTFYRNDVKLEVIWDFQNIILNLKWTKIIVTLKKKYFKIKSLTVIKQSFLATKPQCTLKWWWVGFAIKAFMIQSFFLYSIDPKGGNFCFKGGGGDIETRFKRQKQRKWLKKFHYIPV